MNRSLPLFLLASPLSLLAQPIIDLPNIPVVGDITTIGICDDFVDATALNAATGAMQTWDFSGLNEISEEQFTFVDPTTTPLSSEFPSSNLCGISWENAYSYYAVNGSSLESAGFTALIPGTAPEDTVKIVLNADPEKIIDLPYTYNDNFSDDFSGTFTALGFSGTVDGTSDLTVDGYGTLILPNATYTNAVRYHLNRVQNNVIFGNTTTTTKEQWAWVSADHRFWLLLMELNVDGFSTTQVLWYDKDPALVGTSAISEATASTINVRPNPVVSGASLTIGQGISMAGTQAQLMDATGRLVRTYAKGVSELTTEGLQAGPYLLRVTGPNGNLLHTARVIVN